MARNPAMRATIMAQSCITLVLLVALGLWIVCWFRLQDAEPGFAEALARAIALTLASLGLAVTLLFLLHLAHLPWLPDAALLLMALWSRSHGRRRFFPELLAAVPALRAKPLAWLLTASLGGLAVLAVAVPPANWDSMTYNLARVLLMIQENTLGPTHYTNIRQLAFSPGFDILSFFFLRYGVDRGVALFSWLSYLLIVLGSYAAARRFGDRAFSLRLAFVVGSLKLLVLQATSTKNDIGAAAMAVACMLAGMRFLEKRKPSDMVLLLACAGYGLSTKSYFCFFAVPFTAFVLLAHGRLVAALAWHSCKTQPLRLAAATALLLAVLSLSLAGQGINLARFGDPFGPPRVVAGHRNTDGLAGLGANMVRYALDFVDVPGQWWSDTRRDLHARLFGPGKGPGAFMPFHERCVASEQWHEDAAGFGVLGGLLVFPCIVMGLFRRNRPVRLASLSLVLFLLAVSGTIIWFSFNNRFLSLFFAASAPCLASARKLWHDQTWVRRPVLLAALLTMLAALFGNQSKPLVDARFFDNAPALAAPAIWRETGGRRGVYDRYFGGPLFLDYLSHGLPPKRRALLVAGPDTWVYPILFYAPHDWLVMGDDQPVAHLSDEDCDIRNCRQLQRLARRFDVVVVLDNTPAQSCLAAKTPVMATQTARQEDVLVFSPGAVLATP